MFTHNDSNPGLPVDQNNDLTSHDHAELKQQIEELKDHQKILLREHALAQEKKAALERYHRDPNLFSFYHTIKSKLEDIVISSKSVAGGFAKTRKSETVRNARFGIDILGIFVTFVPFVGEAIDEAIKLAFDKTVGEFGDHRRANTAEAIAKLMTMDEVALIADNVARRLTDAYEEQIKQLELPADDSVDSSHNVMRMVLNIHKVSAVESVADYAIAWIFEKLQNIDKDKPLDEQLVSHILSQSVEASTISEKIDDAARSVLIKFGSNKVNTISGDYFTLHDFYTKPGIRTSSGELFSSKHTDTKKYGYYLGTIQNALQKGLVLESKSADMKNAAPLMAGDADANYISTHDELKSELNSIRSEMDHLKRINEIIQDRNRKMEIEINELSEHRKLFIGNKYQYPAMDSGKDNSVDVSSLQQVISDVKLPQSGEENELRAELTAVKNEVIYLAEQQLATAIKNISKEVVQECVNHVCLRENLGSGKLNSERRKLLYGMLDVRLREAKISYGEVESLRDHLVEAIKPFFRRTNRLRWTDHNVTMTMPRAQMVGDKSLNEAITRGIKALVVKRNGENYKSRN